MSRGGLTKAEAASILAGWLLDRCEGEPTLADAQRLLERLRAGGQGPWLAALAREAQVRTVLGLARAELRALEARGRGGSASH